MSHISDIPHDVGQLLWVGFDGVHLPDALAREIAAGEVGAVILFARNLAREGELIDIRALVELNRALHACAPAGGPGLLIAVDQEGGRVRRVRAPAPEWPPMLTLGPRAGESAETAIARCQEVGLAMGRELRALGFDVDFAPVLDVHTNPANPIIGDRAFAGEPEAAARLALAFARGLERAGIIGCGKHFPGHGDTDTDSHLTLPRLPHDMERLRAVELVPFQRAIAAGIPMIMTAHVVFSALDDRVPATLSERVISGLLRRELGFSGIVVSDDLDMRAISDHFGTADAAVAAVRAGCDALLLCRDRTAQHQAREALIHAAERDSQVRARVAESAARIRAIKAAHARRALPAGDAALAYQLFAEHASLATTLS